LGATEVDFYPETDGGKVRKQKPEKSRERQRQDMYMIWVLLISELLMWTLYGNIATFYPPYRTDHHNTITDAMVGVVLAMFEGGILISSPIVSVLL
jgi:hypothetical protein